MSVHTRRYTPTCFWQLGQLWITSLRESRQKGIKQHPSHPPINATPPQAIHVKVPFVYWVAVTILAWQKGQVIATGFSRNIMPTKTWVGGCTIVVVIVCTGYPGCCWYEGGGCFASYPGAPGYAGGAAIFKGAPLITQTFVLFRSLTQSSKLVPSLLWPWCSIMSYSRNRNRKRSNAGLSFNW